VTLYAIWEQTITYDGNGGDGSVAATTGATGSSVTLSDGTGLTPPDASYTFLGWSTDPNATTQTYAPGETIVMPSGGLDLYAIWDPPIVVSIIYDANGGTGTMSPTSGPEGSTVALAANGFSNTTEFLGWSTSPSGPVEYQPGDDFTLLAGGETLYAIWAPPPPPAQTWTLSYDANGGSCTAPSQTEADGTWVYTYGSDSCTRTGYVFAGWNTSVDGSGLGFAPGSPTVLTGDNTLFAQWVPIKVEASDDVNATLVDSPVSGTLASNDDVPAG
jgi:uncharacterized repeat protein (TIGR02543 family)